MGGLAKETIDMHTQELSDYTLFHVQVQPEMGGGNNNAVKEW